MKELLWPEETVTDEPQDLLEGAAMAAARKKAMAVIVTAELQGVLKGVAVAVRRQKKRTAIVELPAMSPRSARRPRPIEDAKLALEAPTAGCWATCARWARPWPRGDALPAMTASWPLFSQVVPSSC